MNFAAFKAQVLENLGPDAARGGAGTSGLDAFKARAIVNGMVDLQRFIPALRLHNTNTYLEDQVTDVGRAAQIILPVGRLEEIWIGPTTFTSFYMAQGYEPGGESPGSSAGLYTWNEAEQRFDNENGLFWVYRDAGNPPIEGNYGFWKLWSVSQEDVYYYTTATSEAIPGNLILYPDNDDSLTGLAITPIWSDLKRYRLGPHPWAERDALTRGVVEDGDYLYAIGPDNRTCIIHPGLTTATRCEVMWSGLKLTYADGDSLDGNWDQAVEAVAEYAKFRIVRNYDKDAVARSQRHEADYSRLRTALFRELRQ